MDINECVRATDGCSPHAGCINSKGGYTCTCYYGFSGVLRRFSCCSFKLLSHVMPCWAVFAWRPHAQRVRLVANGRKKSSQYLFSRQCMRCCDTK